jgi:hypothetical protein
MIKFFNYLLISSIFIGAFVFDAGYFDFYISYIFFIIFLLTYIFFYRKISIQRNFFYVFLAIFLFSSLNVFQGDNSLLALLKVSAGFIFNGITFYLLIRLNENKVSRLFRVYLQVAFVIALIGIFQEASYLFGIKEGYDFQPFIPRTVPPHVQFGFLKITSIMQEPSHFGSAMAPATFVSILNIIQGKRYFIGKKMSFFILSSAVLTFSLVTYIGIIFAFILIMFNYRKATLICTLMTILLVFMVASYKYLPGLQMRVDQTIAVISGKTPLEKVNLSTFAFCSNGLVALKSFSGNPLFGSGLGSHSSSYDKYISQIVNQDLVSVCLNREDAASLFFRLISETGLFGVSLFFYFILRFYVSKTRDDHFWIISNAILCLFVLTLLRQGNYFYNGFIFFVWLYYFAHKSIQDNIKFA